MRNKHGDFIWYELLTPDVAAAQRFYGKVLGWQFEKFEHPDMNYVLASALDEDTGKAREVVGLMELTQGMKSGGAHPVWLGYIGVDDVDEFVNRVGTAGGSTLMPPWDIANVGRLAMVTDPQGVPFYLMRGASDEASHSFAADKPRPGHCAWNELATPDQPGAWKFYGELFGWQKDGEMDMGPMGSYEFIRHGSMLGAIMPKPAEMPVPMWSFYFRVANIDVAAGRVADNGGQVMFGPSEVPGGDFIITGVDPQGAVFSLVGKRQ